MKLRELINRKFLAQVVLLVLAFVISLWYHARILLDAVPGRPPAFDWWILRT